MGPKAEQRKKGAAMQEARKEASPDWLAEGGYTLRPNQTRVGLTQNSTSEG